MTARKDGAIEFVHPVAFWTGVLASAAGVALHLPMYWSTRAMGFRMAGMTPDPAMITGMALIGAGLVLCAYGLIPGTVLKSPGALSVPRVRPADDAPLTVRHGIMLLVMTVAVTIDVMKPTTLSFVQPGVAGEYGLRSALNPHSHGLPVALLPLAGISGTVIGSFIWGWLGDRIGRRPAILLAALLFITTSICGAMPGFSWNLLMCFIMGIGAGGLLPLAFTLIAETVPGRHRGWAMVLVGADAALAYIITSWLAGWLTPHYSWRILWLIGLPTGLLLVLLNRWIPESPRFLLATGRVDEARVIMEAYGTQPTGAPAERITPGRPAGAYQELLSRPHTGLAISVMIAAIGTGFVTYGFQLWLPTNLQAIGLTGVTAAAILRNSALLGFPLTLLVAWTYSFWSSVRTIIGLCGITAAALIGLVVAGSGLDRNHLLLSVLLAVPVATMGTLAAVLTAYCAEVYPTRVRSRAAGLAAGTSKAGGVVIIALVVAALAAPSLTTTALIAGIPLILAIPALSVSGMETRRRALEDIIDERFPVMEDGIL